MSLPLRTPKGYAIAPTRRLLRPRQHSRPACRASSACARKGFQSMKLACTVCHEQLPKHAGAQCTHGSRRRTADQRRACCSGMPAGLHLQPIGGAEVTATRSWQAATKAAGAAALRRSTERLCMRHHYQQCQETMIRRCRTRNLLVTSRSLKHCITTQVPSPDHRSFACWQASQQPSRPQRRLKRL